ncbi:potassium channel family protein [Synoicihabitans lomoniglobus]|uniref:NAD-binding protein n=1 Tax=Synoicihabitans lomoniglobus TaxID=2909285 RepID=A0AAE9ZVZ6_9BACT|nr:NAD-binding protein [Opitutaceae bacterium LMO-M01]WED65236.1 NAD-binding protein [Opitutaceae bacterium LMO-M01]
MKALTSVLATFLESRTSRHNLLTLGKLLLIFAVLVASFSVLFHVLMEHEGQHHTWITGFYWTLTVMSTLGFGDITFHTDTGRFFSLIVLGTGVVFLLVLLPFTFIEFFYTPWMKAQATARAPRELPAETENHVILTLHGPMTKILVRMLEKHHHPYFILVPTVAEALEMHERNIPVVVGDLSDPDTYRRLRIEQAAMVVTTRSDVINTNVTFSVREVSESVLVIASARSSAARDVLELAGVSHILSLEEMMGQALSRRVVSNAARAQIIGNRAELVIAETSAYGTTLVGQTVAESGLRPKTGLTVVGIWDHGQLVPAEPTSLIEEHTVFILAGTAPQVETFNTTFAVESPAAAKPASRVVIVGGGRVGRATARALDEREIAWTIIEKDATRVTHPENTQVGDASEFEVLVKAGMHEASSILITTHDDDTNIFLTIFYRKLRPRTQIISRCTHEGNVGRLHRAGADLVLSYASMSANSIYNYLRGSEALLLAEGVSLFSVPVPQALHGRTLTESQVPTLTGCSILAIESGDQRELNLSPGTIIPPTGELILIGSLAAEEKFLNAFPS